MTDKELLELAAKAAGINVKGVFEDEDTLLIKPAPGLPPARWNPLKDDGDALRLAVKLHISPWQNKHYEACIAEPAKGALSQKEAWGNDPYSATRRAIVRAAAAIGKDMK